MRPGDIVVRPQSKARTLKRKVYRVIQVHGDFARYGTLIEVIDPYGNKKGFRYQELESLDTFLYRAENAVGVAKRIVQNAELAELNLRKEIKEVPRYFPSI